MRHFAALAFALLLIVPAQLVAATLRLSFGAASLEALDPARIGDMWGQAQAGPLFDQLYTYDYLARPVRLVPLAADGMPQISPDGREIVVTIRAGILFSPHPAFGGTPRELTAADFVYSVKRIADPALHSPSFALLADKVEGLDAWGEAPEPGHQPGTRLVLERNPRFRQVRWEELATPTASDAATFAALRGRRFPLPDRVELVHIPEPVTGLFALEKRQINVRSVTTALAMDDERLKPRLAQAGFQLVRGMADPSFIAFNLRDPQVGGTSPERIALRRAIAMAIDDEEYLRVLFAGNGAATRHPVPPGIAGHDPAYSPPFRFDPSTANALLDRMGYRKGSDGYRRNPDGSALALSAIIATNSESRRLAELLKRSFDRIGLKLGFDAMQAGGMLRRIRACRFQLLPMEWGLDWPGGSNLMLAFHGASTGSVNVACMQDAEFDAAFERLMASPAGADRGALFRRMVDRLDQLMPARFMPTRHALHLASPNVRGLVVHPVLLALYISMSTLPHRRNDPTRNFWAAHAKVEKEFVSGSVGDRKPDNVIITDANPLRPLMSLLELTALIAVAALGWFAWSSLRAREAANAAIRSVCAQHALLFLDDTVGLESMWPVRNDDGQLTLRRLYAFEYSDTGHNRRKGTVTVIGEKVSAVSVRIPVPEGETLH